MKLKRVLLLFTHYRICEKIMGMIPELSKHYDIDLYLLGQMSLQRKWEGDIDLRKDFLDKYKKNISNVIIGDGVDYFRTRTNNVMSRINLNNYVGVIYDDNRYQANIEIDVIYKECKKLGIPMIGNAHGNQWYDRDNWIAFEQSYNHMFVLGNKEKDYYSNFYPFNNIHAVGIPTNDTLKNKELNKNHILVIPNFLSNRESPFAVNFDSRWSNYITKLSKQFNLPIKVKQKTRTDDPDWQKNVKFIESLFKDVDLQVVSDTEDIDTLISNSNIVISAYSTLAFKSIQMGICTLLVRDSGAVGNFFDYPYTIDIDNPSSVYLENWNLDTKWLSNTIEGGDEFNSSKIYVEKVKNIIK